VMGQTGFFDVERRLSLPAVRAAPPASSRPFPQPGPLPRSPSCELSPRLFVPGCRKSRRLEASLSRSEKISQIPERGTHRRGGAGAPNLSVPNETLSVFAFDDLSGFYPGRGKLLRFKLAVI